MKRNVSIMLFAVLVTALFGCSKSTAIINEANTYNETVVQTNMDTSLVITELILDQEDSFIALSSNDATGFNRWIPFYFSLQTKLDHSVEEIEALLKENISKITLYDEKNTAILTTDELIWTPYKLEEYKYNLTLVIQADLNNTIFNQITKLNKIDLDINGGIIEYTLSNYLLEARETISEDVIYSSQSTMETSFSEELYAAVNYGVIAKGIDSSSSLELDYPESFANIKNYNIEAPDIDKEGNIVYRAKVYFAEPNNKVVFRPFIHVISSDGETEGWLVPAVPAYIK